MTKTPLGLYIHVPFCLQKCPYCDFYSQHAKQTIIQRYVQTVIQEIRDIAQLYQQEADTLYFGGGTPTLLTPSQICAIVKAAKEVFSLNKAEITMEANPETLTQSNLYQYRLAGCNRLSIGMQTGVEKELVCLGRKHSMQQIFQAITWAREAGFRNLSLDLMLGIPYQTEDSFFKTCDVIKSLNPDHLSAYMLKVEKGTPYYQNPVLKNCLDDDHLAELYQTAVSQFAKMGLLQYEISNFAKKGYKCRHNLKYWRCQPYLGFGPSAHSFYEHTRFCQPKDLCLFLKNGWNEQIVLDRDAGNAQEYILLGLRLNEGISLSVLEKRYGFNTKALQQRALFLQKNGLMNVNQERISLTVKGMLVSNSIITSLL